jgi:hypothetical protein
MMEEAKKLLDKMNLKHYKSTSLGEGRTLEFYRETLPNFLASEYVVRMILSKQSCPEE